LKKFLAIWEDVQTFQQEIPKLKRLVIAGSKEAVAKANMTHLGVQAVTTKAEIVQLKS